MNDDAQVPQVTAERKGEAVILLLVTITICVLALECVGVQSLCVIYKIPDMNTTLSNSFMHITDTVIGALIGWAGKTAAQKLTSTGTTPSEPTGGKQ